MAVDQYLDWFDFFVNQICGGWEVFVIIAIFLIAMMAARYRLNNQVTFFLIIVFGLLMGRFFPILLGVILLLVGLYVGWQYLKTVSR